MSKLNALLTAARRWRNCKDLYHDYDGTDGLTDPLFDYRQSIKALGAAIQDYDAEHAAGIQWKRVATFWVPGEPAPQPRPKARAMKIGGKVTAQVYNPKSADGWKLLVSCHGAGRIASPLDCPVMLSIDFYCARPKSSMRKRDAAGPILNITRPDVDNYAKSTIDAMQDSGWFVDDSRIADLRVRKLYHAKDGKPGAMITVSVIDDQQMMLGGGA